LSLTVSGDPSLLHFCAVQSAHPGHGSPVLLMLPSPLEMLSSWTLALLSTLLVIVPALLYVLPISILPSGSLLLRAISIFHSILCGICCCLLLVYNVVQASKRFTV